MIFEIAQLAAIVLLAGILLAAGYWGLDKISRPANSGK